MGISRQSELTSREAALWGGIGADKTRDEEEL